MGISILRKMSSAIHQISSSFLNIIVLLNLKVVKMHFLIAIGKNDQQLIFVTVFLFILKIDPCTA